MSKGNIFIEFYCSIVLYIMFLSSIGGFQHQWFHQIYPIKTMEQSHICKNVVMQFMEVLKFVF